MASFLKSLYLFVICLQVKSLKDFETAGKFDGLVNWRNTICVKENLFASQQDNDSLFDRLEKEPALKYALTGDRNIIVTPCLLPPSKSKVEEWFKGRKLYKALKKQSVIVKTDNVIKDVLDKTSPDDDEHYESGEVCLNLFTGKREVVHNGQSEDDKPPLLVKEESNDIKVNDSDKAGADVSESKVRDSGGIDEELDISPPSKQSRLDETAQFHSTPLTRRSSTDLFESGCTPIGSCRETPTVEDEGNKEEDQSEMGFVTPKRIRPPLRRLSTNTESTLRRAIINTQMKVLW